MDGNREVVIPIPQGLQTARCAADHFGSWAVEPDRFAVLLELVRKGGDWWLREDRRPFGSSDDRLGELEQLGIKISFAAADGDGRKRTFPVTSDGVAILGIIGHMTKGTSSFGGTSTVRVRRQLTQARRDPSVAGVLLVVDSPGGTVAGTEELARDVREAAEEKPVHVFVDDLAASAAFWVASQADWISAGPLAMIGSIGTFTVVVDSSERAKEEGFKVHLITTGPHKGAGVPGVPISDKQLAHFQETVEQMNAHFVSGVSRGRNVSLDVVAAEWADGRTHLAAVAEEMGMIDEVARIEDAIETIRAAISDRRAPSTTAASRPRSAAARRALLEALR